MTTETQFPLLVKAEARQRQCRRAVRSVAAQARLSVRDVDLTLEIINCDPSFACLFEGQDDQRRRQTLAGILECGLKLADA